MGTPGKGDKSAFKTNIFLNSTMMASCLWSNSEQKNKKTEKNILLDYLTNSHKS